MRIAIDIDRFYPGVWNIAGGAIQRVSGFENNYTILLPHSPNAREEDVDPTTWDAAIVVKPRPDLTIPQVTISPLYCNDIPSVTFDQDKVVQLALDQFISMGLTSLACFGQEDSLINYRPLLTRFARHTEALNYESPFISSENPNDALLTIRKPCGILACDDFLGGLLIRKCRKIGLRVPGDVYVISIGNTPTCLKSSPRLTSIVLPYSSLGFEAVHMCRWLVRNKPMESLKLEPSGLVIRESTKIENDDLRSATDIAYFLRTNFSYPIQMVDIVRRSSRSRTQIIRVFSSIYGVAPIAYLKDIRLARAKELLRLNEMKIKDIADECGYRDSNHLCRVFRKHVGQSPQSYAKSHADN